MTLDTEQTLSGPVVRSESRPRITGRLAQFIVETTLADVPTRVVQLAKQSFLDTVGIALGGMAQQAPQILSAFVLEQGVSSESTVLLRGVKTSACYAAWINGTAADIEGYSDVSVRRMHHPSVSPLAALWALGESRNTSGRDILLAHIIGVEVASKIAAGVQPILAQKGWHPLAVLGTFGAAAAAAKLMALDADTTANALGIAGAEASGIRVSNGTMSKAYGAGRSARDGLYAALLAARGFTGAVNVIEGRDGFLQTFGNGAEGDAIVENLGSPYDFLTPGIALKKFPSCTRSHNGIQAILNLKQKYALTTDMVDAVVCLVTPAVVDYLKFPKPRDKFEAKYSLEYCVASALVHGGIDLSTFDVCKLEDPIVRGLMQKIKVEVWDEFAKDGYSPSYAPNGCLAKITTKDGRLLQEQVNHNPWDPIISPPSWDDVVSKFTSIAGEVLGASRAQQVIEIVSELENLASLRQLMELLAAPPLGRGN